MKKIFQIILVITLTITLCVSNAEAQFGVSIKQLTQVKGVRENQLQGYGIVTGLEGKGDSDKSKFTMSSIISMLKNYGISVDEGSLKVNNCAAVMITMTLLPFSREGQKYDVVVSSIGDAKTLEGGELLQSPLFGADRKVYAVAQGRVTIGGFNVSSGGAKIQKNHPTAGRVPEGAIIERELPTEFVFDNNIELSLNAPDFMTAAKVTEAINLWAQSPIAQSLDAGAIQIAIPEKYKSNPVLLLAQIEKIQIVPEKKARLVINEKTGTIVIGEGVKLASTAIAHGNLTVVISTETSVSQPNPLSEGETVTTEKKNISVTETGSKVMMLNEGSTIGDVVKALNSIGATPRDIISIIQALKESGALYADLVLM